MQLGAIGTDIHIVLSIIPKVALSKELGPLVKIRQRNVGTNVLLFECDNILCGSIGRVAGKLAWMQLPAETCSPEEVKHRLVFHHF